MSAVNVRGVVQIVGWSGSGKTTLLEALLPRLRALDLRVACVKHSGGFDEVDRRGKDSFRLRAAGSETVVLVSPSRSVVFLDHGEGALTWQECLALARARDVDVVLFESFGSAPLPKLEVYRQGVGKATLRAVDDSLLRAVISDDPVPGYRGELVSPGDLDRITEVVLELAGIEPRSS